ncbi:401_t:CDS:2 [Diversispora eburnea]|uniref:Histone H4 n=1 Tax=Diversispora eburnea TaxID=1213867 RepID=A0A9N9FD22_9GLOM|nr:401_t:CDS:2 [Diversispora eburnea]
MVRVAAGRGKSGKGLGKGGKVSTQRHRNIKGITKPDIRRLARRGGVKRISAQIYDNARNALKDFLTDTLKDVIAYVEYERKKTIGVMEILLALKRRGQTLYGFEGQPPLCLSTIGAGIFKLTVEDEKRILKRWKTLFAAHKPLKTNDIEETLNSNEADDKDDMKISNSNEYHRTKKTSNSLNIYHRIEERLRLIALVIDLIAMAAGSVLHNGCNDIDADKGSNKESDKDLEKYFGGYGTNNVNGDDRNYESDKDYEYEARSNEDGECEEYFEMMSFESNKNNECEIFEYIDLNSRRNLEKLLENEVYYVEILQPNY